MSAAGSSIVAHSRSPYQIKKKYVMPPRTSRIITPAASWYNHPDRDPTDDSADIDDVRADRRVEAVDVLTSNRRDGYTIPSKIRAYWWYGTEHEYSFFKAAITSARFF